MGDFVEVGVRSGVGVGVFVGVGALVGVGVFAGVGVEVGVGSGSLRLTVRTFSDQFTEDKFPPLVR